MSLSSKWPQPVQAFEYPSVLGGAAVPVQRKIDEDAAREAHIREHAQRESEMRLRQEFDRLVAEERRHIRKAVTEFVGERETYFRRVEAEVVQLALAVARRILHR